MYTPIVAASALMITPSASVAIDSSGHIDVAGTETAMPVRRPTGLDLGTRNDFAVAQYNPDGSLNTSFGTAGVATIDIGTNLNGNSVPTDDYASGLAVQSDGKIVVSGTAFEPTSDPNVTDSSFAVTRLNVDGSIDSSFGNEGRAIADFPVTFFDFGPPYVSLDVATSLALTPNGKIVVAGLTDFGTFFFQNAFALAQFNTDGSLGLELRDRRPRRCGDLSTRGQRLQLCNICPGSTGWENRRRG